jgi:hypothetical protein
VTKPTDTNIKYQYSINSGESWNGSWLTEEELETALQGISCAGDGNDKIRFKFQLNTAAILNTPEIDNLAVGYWTGYEASGSYISTAYSPQPTDNGVYLGTVAYDTTLPSGCSAVVHVRAIDHVLEENYDTPWTTYSSGEYIGTLGTLVQFEAELTGPVDNTPRLNSLEVDLHFVPNILRKLWMLELLRR